MRLYTMSEYLGLGENCQETHKRKDIYRIPLKESEWGLQVINAGRLPLLLNENADWNKV